MYRCRDICYYQNKIASFFLVERRKKTVINFFLNTMNIPNSRDNSNRVVSVGQSKPTGDRNDFVIGKYLHILTPNEKEKGKFYCPVCDSDDLSVNTSKRNEENYAYIYDCYGCHDTNKIAYELRKLAGEFDGRKNSYKRTDKKQASQVSKSDNKRNTANQKSKSNSDDVDKLVLQDAVDINQYLLEKYEFYFKDKEDRLCKEIVGLNWGERLRFNIRTNDVYLDDSVLNLSTLTSEIADKYNASLAYEVTIRQVIYLAQKNEFDPVKDMLDACRKQFLEKQYSNLSIPDFTWEELCLVLFGVNDPLYVAYFRCWLLGAIARVYYPGCKFDEVLVLHGKPDRLKSTFFSVLAGSEFFTDSMRNLESNQGLLIMRQKWLVEWAEIENMTRKTYEGVIKSFLSCSVDIYRDPYGKNVISHPRNSVIVGTCNRDTFLTDVTGNRRFWVIPILSNHKIPIDDLKLFREDLLGWATSQLLDHNPNPFSTGVTPCWVLPQEFKVAQAEDNEQWLHQDPWENIIDPYLELSDDEVTIFSILKHLEREGYEHKYTRFDEMRVADILKTKKWERKRVTRGDKRIYVYISFNTGV